MSKPAELEVQEVTFEQLRKQLSDLLSQVAFKGEPIVVTRHGKRLAAVMPIETFEITSALLEALRAYQTGQSFDPDRATPQLTDLTRSIEHLASHLAIERAKAHQGDKPFISSAAVKQALGLD